MHYNVLKTELARSPYSGKSDVEVAAILNDAKGDQAGEVDADVLTKGEFLLKIVPATLRLPTLSEAIQKKWDRILALAEAATEFHVNDANIQGLLALAVADGLLTADEAEAVKKKAGSRGETLGFGRVEYWDVARARAL